MINNEIYTLRDVSQKNAGPHIIRTVIARVIKSLSGELLLQWFFPLFDGYKLYLYCVCTHNDLYYNTRGIYGS